LPSNVRSGSNPEVELADADFRFAPDSRHPAVGLACPFGANNGSTSHLSNTIEDLDAIAQTFRDCSSLDSTRRRPMRD
jgi:hypothetical protein